MSTITLIGYLGKDREVRQTCERTLTATIFNHIAEMTEEYEVTIRPRDFIVLSLATHQGSKTAWDRLVVWSPDRRGLSKIRLARKGDRVRVTGRPEIYRFKTADGTIREVPQLIVETIQILKLKIRSEAP